MPIQRLWDVLQVCNIVTTTMIEREELPAEIKTMFSEQGYLGGEQSTTEEWRVQGIKFFKKKQFDQAMKCFKFAD